MKKILSTAVFSMLFIFGTSTLSGQQILMQGWYWDYPKTADAKSWADTLRLKAAALKQAGISHIWIPPHTVASSGTGSNGYDPKDLFIGNQTTGLGTRPSLNAMLSEFTSQGIMTVADVIYNHRDGGAPENNPAVKSYITTHYTSAKEPFPSDRFRCILPLGGATGNVAGDYYFKISSKTNASRFNNYGYKVYMETKTKGFQSLPAQNESEPNGGGDCGQGNNSISIGRDMLAVVETGGSCGTDEFYLNLGSADFNAAGDTLFIYITNTGGYSDHRIYGIWAAPRSQDIANEIQYQTYTNYAGMPSGRGQMNYEFFKPNTANTSSTFLNGDWDGMYFYYDYDQFHQPTKDSLINYTKWNWTDLGVRGFRMDAVKHFTPEFVGDMLDSMNHYGMNPSLVVGEWYSTNASELSGWINNVKAAMNASSLAAIQPKIFDFTLRENLRQACDDAGFDVRNVFNGSLRDAASMSGFNIVTFVNNHDFRDGSGFASLVRNNPDLAYAYILTNNQLGVPTIFYPDYYGYPAPSGGQYSYHPTNLPAYQPRIDQLMKALNLYINGSPSVDYLSRFSTPYAANYVAGSASKALIYQLEGFAGNGNKDVIVAINFGSTTLQVDQTINTRGGAITPGTHFSDVLGYSAFPFQVVDGSNRVYIELPPYSYSVWVQGDLFVLPLKLTEFQAMPKDKKVKLDWKISDNQEASGFEVQRSADRLNFTSIGSVDATSINGDAVYQFTDERPVFNTPVLYRLKIIYKNGREEFSDYRLVRINNSDIHVVVNGNQVNDRLQFSVWAPGSRQVTASVFTVGGQQLSSQVLNISENRQAFDIPVSQLAAGVYRLVVNDGIAAKTISFVKN